MAELALTNVIDISVSQAQAGVGDYNTSNLAIFSSDAAADSFGDLGYKIYSSPKDVATDFGTGSTTYAQANAVFSQKPNILAGNGYLVIIPLITAIQHNALSGVAASGTWVWSFEGNPSAPINWNDTASQIQAKLRAIPGLESVVVTGSIASQSLDVALKGVYGPQSSLAVSSNSLATSGPVAITFTTTSPTAGETLADGITRTEDLVQYFGVIGTVVFEQADELAAAAAVIQALNKLVFFVGTDEADVQAGGKIDMLTTGGFTQSRGLYYGSNDAAALVFLASYASRGLSTNFNGSNTTQTLHLKDLLGVQPDPSMTQTILNLCQDAGADVYVSLQGVPKIFCSGENSFFDQVYNLEWFVGALQVAGFNYLAQSATKVPQTEQGMDGLKGAYRKVCDQAVTNQYCAPGEWNSATTFGNQSDFLQNIQQKGYYIFSQPISKQSQTAREARQAPLVQIALKEAGAIHSSSVVVYVNP